MLTYLFIFVAGVAVGIIAMKFFTNRVKPKFDTVPPGIEKK